MCLHCTATSAAVLTYNVALNKSAYQSSVYFDRYNVTHPAHLANDGSHTATGAPHSCAQSNASTNPWWAVDLGRPTAIYRVDFTNVVTNNGLKTSGMNSYVFTVFYFILFS